MKIGELANASGASVRSIRHYETAGLLKVSRRRSGYRDFDMRDVALVSRIRRMIGLGFTTAEIVRFLPQIIEESGSDCSLVTEAHRAKLADVERQIEELELRREALRTLLQDIHPTAVE